VLVCFEAPTDGLPHDYTLSCESNSLAYSLLVKLVEICRIYNDGMDDCARYFTNTTNFGPGFFAGDRCSVRYHDDGVPADPCVIDVLNQNTPTGFGTGADYAIAIGIPLALLLASSFVFYKCWANSRNQPQAQVAANANERTGLLEAQPDEIHPPVGNPEDGDPADDMPNESMTPG
jgi:hypothetical protein